METHHVQNRNAYYSAIQKFRTLSENRANQQSAVTLTHCHNGVTFLLQGVYHRYEIIKDILLILPDACSMLSLSVLPASYQVRLNNPDSSLEQNCSGEYAGKRDTLYPP